jgi:Ribonucleases G and E
MKSGPMHAVLFMVQTVGPTSSRVEAGTWGFPAFVLHIGATVLLNGRSGMGIEIAITVAREETRVAVLDGGVVTDLFGDRAKHKDFVGNIYKGKVAKVLPGMQAAFVDIGLAKAAFMHVSDLSLDAEPGDTLVDADEDDKDADKDGDMLGPRRQSSKPIEQLLSEGQELMVQISKGPIGTKGSRVTTYVSLPGDTSCSCPMWNISVSPAASPVTRSGHGSRTS